MHHYLRTSDQPTLDIGQEKKNYGFALNLKFKPFPYKIQLHKLLPESSKLISSQYYISEEGSQLRLCTDLSLIPFCHLKYVIDCNALEIK